MFEAREGLARKQPAASCGLWEVVWRVQRAGRLWSPLRPRREYGWAARLKLASGGISVLQARSAARAERARNCRVEDGPKKGVLNPRRPHLAFDAKIEASDEPAKWTTATDDRGMKVACPSFLPVTYSPASVSSISMQPSV